MVGTASPASLPVDVSQLLLRIFLDDAVDRRFAHACSLSKKMVADFSALHAVMTESQDGCPNFKFNWRMHLLK